MNSYWNFEHTKAVTLHCAEVGGGKDRGPAIQVTHLIGYINLSVFAVYEHRFQYIIEGFYITPPLPPKRHTVLVRRVGIICRGVIFFFLLSSGIRKKD